MFMPVLWTLIQLLMHPSWVAFSVPSLKELLRSEFCNAQVYLV